MKARKVFAQASTSKLFILSEKKAIFSVCKQFISTKHDQICSLNIPQTTSLWWILLWHLMQFKTFQLPVQPY